MLAHILWSVLAGILAWLIAGLFTDDKKAKIIGVVIAILVFLGILL